VFLLPVNIYQNCTFWLWFSASFKIMVYYRCHCVYCISVCLWWYLSENRLFSKDTLLIISFISGDPSGMFWRN